MKQQNKSTLMDNYSYLFRNFKMFWQREGGKICTIAGTTGLFLTGLHASRKTYLIHDELKETGERLAKAHEIVEGESKTKRILRIGKEYAKATLSTGKHYIPDLIGGGVSAYSSAKGWKHEHNNYSQAAKMAGVIAASFMNYRMNVISEEGKEADLKYLTTKHESKDIKEATPSDETKQASTDGDNTGDLVVEIKESDLVFKYSEATTPMVWSESKGIRIANLEQIRRNLTNLLVAGGSYTVNEFRREFFGKKRGDVETGDIWGRIWDPGNPEHPERGRLVNLHYEDDKDFMDGIKDWCYIQIEIDDEPLFESRKIKKKKDQDRGYFTPVEPIW